MSDYDTWKLMGPDEDGEHTRQQSRATLRRWGVIGAQGYRWKDDGSDLSGDPNDLSPMEREGQNDDLFSDE